MKEKEKEKTIQRIAEVIAASQHMEGLCTQHDRLNFQQGARWADCHPQSPWISVSEQKLPRNKELLLITQTASTANPLEPVIGHIDDDGNVMSPFVGWYCDAKYVWYWMPIPPLPEKGGNQ